MGTSLETTIDVKGFDYVTYKRTRSTNATVISSDVKNKFILDGLGENVSILKEKHNKPIERNIAPENFMEQQESVPATVLRDDDVSILCEVELQAGHIQIRLPRSLFTTEIHHGMPISISFDEDRFGIRKPSISLRQIDIEPLYQENEDMRALVEKF